MGKALYRSHRPKKLDEVVGQEHITTTLQHALSSDAISHAYLFTGPHGTGKTTIARILAHEINQLPYEDDRTHLDIIEVDAASNRRIDEIRDLRDKIHIAPSSAKYKVYIIDEVHMLTREAFNALLKTLEEPPAHVVFILATTEAHKLPETIVSRTQRFTFRPVDLTAVAKHLQEIAQKEGIKIAPDALELVAAHGEGSFRDSISLLDQARNRGQEVKLADVQGMLGVPPAELISEIVSKLESHDASGVAAGLLQLHTQGFEPATAAKQLGQVLRDKLLAQQTTLPHDVTLDLLAALVDVPASHDPRIALELALLDVALGDEQSALTEPPAPEQPKPSSKVMPAAVHPKPPTNVAPHSSTFKKPIAPAATFAEIAEDAENTEASEPDSGAEPLTPEIWKQVLASIKKTHNTLYGIIRASHAHFEPGLLNLELGYAFHQKRINDAQNQQILSNTIHDISGQFIKIRCTVGEAQSESPAPELPPEENEKIHEVEGTPPLAEQAKSAEAPDATAITAIFGGGEVLES